MWKDSVVSLASSHPLHKVTDLGTSSGTASHNYFDVLLTVRLSIFISIINQIDAQNLFYNKFISCLYMFRKPCAHRQEGKNCIIQPLVSSHL